MGNQVRPNRSRTTLRGSKQRDPRGASFDALNQQREPAFAGALERLRENGGGPPQQNEPAPADENARPKPNRGLNARVEESRSRFGQPNFATGAADRGLSNPNATGINQSALQNIVQGAVSDQRDAKQDAQLDQVVTSAQEAIQNRGPESAAQTLDEREVELRRQAGEENPVGSRALAEQEAQQRQNPQGLRRINREDLRQGLADGSLGTFSVEGRDSRTLRSARDAAGIGPDGSLVFDQQGLARLGNRLSSSSPAPGNEITPDQRINDREATGSISPEQAAGERSRQTAREQTAAELAIAGGEAAAGQQGQQGQQFDPESVAAKANSLIGITEDDENPVTAAEVGIILDNAGRSNSVPEGFNETDAAGVAAVARSFPDLGGGNPFFSDDPTQPLRPGPVFDLLRDMATAPPGQTEFTAGGQPFDLTNDIPARVRTFMNDTAERFRRGFADSAAQTFFQETSSGKSAEEAEKALTPNERKAAKSEFERFKQQNVAQLRQRFLQQNQNQNQNRTLREREQNASAGDGRFSPFFPEQQAQLEAARNQDFDEFLAQRAAGILNGQR